MNNYDLFLLTRRPLVVRPEAIKAAAKILSDRDREAIRAAKEKRERKRAATLARESR